MHNAFSPRRKVITENLVSSTSPILSAIFASLILNFFEKGDDNIYRAVVFTHGGFIDIIFKIKAENNDIVHAIINSENALSLKLAYEHYRIKPMTDDIKYKCPNGCKISFCP